MSHDTYYLIGTAAGPHPYPAMVRDFQSVIGERGPRADAGGRGPAARRGGGLRRRRLQRHRPLPSVPGRRGRAPDRRRGGRRTAWTPASTPPSLDRRPAGRAARQPDLSAAGRRRPDHRGPLDLRRPRLSRHRPRARLAARHRPRRNTSSATDDEALDGLPALRRAGGHHPGAGIRPRPGPAAGDLAREVGKDGIDRAEPVAAAATRTWPPSPPRLGRGDLSRRSRIDARFAALKAEGRAAFVAYVMAGDPDAGDGAGDPAGPAGRRRRHHRAGLSLLRSHGRRPADPARRAARAEGRHDAERRAGPGARASARATQATPIVLMGYLNPMLTYGFERFAADAAAAGRRRPDRGRLPARGGRSAGRRARRGRHGADPPGDADHRRRAAAGRASGARSGFVYYVSVAGVTGVKEADAAAVAPAVERVRRASGLPVAVGFGIRTPERAAAVARVADAAVVGSALVDEIAQARSHEP